MNYEYTNYIYNIERLKNLSRIEIVKLSLQQNLDKRIYQILRKVNKINSIQFNKQKININIIFAFIVLKALDWICDDTIPCSSNRYF